MPRRWTKPPIGSSDRRGWSAAVDSRRRGRVAFVRVEAPSAVAKGAADVRRVSSRLCERSVVFSSPGKKFNHPDPIPHWLASWLDTAFSSAIGTCELVGWQAGVKEGRGISFPSASVSGRALGGGAHLPRQASSSREVLRHVDDRLARRRRRSPPRAQGASTLPIRITKFLPRANRVSPSLTSLPRTIAQTTAREPIATTPRAVV